MQIDVRKMESPQAAEFYIHAAPTAGAPVDRQAGECFDAIAHVLRGAGARIVEERLFGVREAMATAVAARLGAYGDLDDGVSPTVLAVPNGMQGALSGVLVHAVCCEPAPRPVCLESVPCGRAMDTPEGQYVTLSGLTAPDAGDACAQARAMLEKSQSALGCVGGDFHSVVRTWMWLGDILAWYGPFNEVRNRFFHERDLLNDRSGKRQLPASTGIGVGPAGPGACAMDLVALIKSGVEPDLLLAGGDQNPAYDYGSAFSRASRSATPGGQTVFVSGTAAIDFSGETEHVGNIPAQVEATIQHVRAVLRDTHCTDDDVIDSLIYCKTPEVEAHFREAWAEKLPWPQIIMISDVCRDDLLFEIEAAAAPGATRV